MRRRLFWRVYLHGLLLLGLIALFMAGFHWARGKPPWSGAPQRVVKMLSADLESPEKLQARVTDLAYLLDCELGVFDASGIPLARAPESFSGLSAEERSALAEDGRLKRRRTVAMTLDATGAHVVAHWGWHHRGGRFLWALLGLLVVLAVGSIPLARGLVRPLEKLTETARRLGEGDLEARAGLDRKDEIGQLARAMDEMAARLQQALLSERELLANVGHELRTPLARVRVALAIAEEDGVDLQGLPGDLAELEALVEDVLAAGRLDRARELPLSVREVDWRAFAEQAGERFRTRYPEVPLSVHCDAPPSPADPSLMARLVDNLLANAARHGQGEAVTLTLTEGLRVEVSDRGPGVPPDELARLFEPFHRVDAARTGGGVGLGLTLCRRIAEAHGGTIHAEPVDPHGLRVVARIGPVQ